MVYTTSEQVQTIIETDQAVSLGVFIMTAHELVVEVCLPSGYTNERLELIERWLSAHFYAIRDMRVANEKAGSVGQSFQFKLGLNLSVTMYGQQALILDTKGGLAALSKKSELGLGKASLSWLGKQ